LGYVAIEHANLDSEIYIDIRNSLVKAKVAKAPFA
jgi:aminomethyltransferase